MVDQRANCKVNGGRGGGCMEEHLSNMPRLWVSHLVSERKGSGQRAAIWLRLVGLRV